MTAKPDITQLLNNVTAGDSSAANELLPLVYDELRRLAESRLRGERAAHTLQATALVHEAYLKLVDIDRIDIQSRAHFFALASTAIRRILVDHARRRNAEKRGGGEAPLPLKLAAHVGAKPEETDILALNQALERFSQEEPEKARVIELRFFAGLTAEETAAVLGVTTRTVERHWRFGRAWIYDAMTG